jgi:hypothetical protein
LLEVVVEVVEVLRHMLEAVETYRRVGLYTHV